MAKKKEKSKEDSIRIRNIQEWLIQGQLVVDICRNIMELWKIDESSAIKMIADAFDDFSKRTSKKFTEIRALHIQMRLSLYKKAVEAKEFRVALQILNDLAKIEGIYDVDD